MGFSDQDAIFALGIVPVGMRRWIEDRAVWPWNEEEVGDAEPELLPSGELNFERIAALEPDLITGVYSGLTEDEYGTLSEIAPTVAQSGEYVDFGTPWQKMTRTIGRALGREGRAEDLVNEIEGRFEEARRRHPEFEGATGIFAGSFEAGTYNVYSPEDPRGRFLVSLGFEIPDEVRDITGERFNAEISGERLDLLDADLLAWIIAVGGTREAVEENPLYRRLDVFEQERALFLEPGDPLQAALSYSTVLSLPFAMEEAVPRIAAAIDGDPETRVEGAVDETTG